MPKVNPKDNAKISAISELIRQGKEQECIELLGKYGPSKVKELNDGTMNIWHLAVQNNCRDVVEYLTHTNHDSIDCLNAQHLTPWALAVIQNKPTIARLLEDKGANTGTFVDKEESQTLLHRAVANSDIALLNNCIDCNVPGNIVDSKGFTASYYARSNKNKRIAECLKQLRFADFADSIDLNNSVITNDAQALTFLLQSGADPKKIKSPNLLDKARIYNCNNVIEILRKAGVSDLMTEEEIREIRRKKFGKKPNPLIESYANEKLSLKKSIFKISPHYLTAITLLTTLVLSAFVTLALAVTAGVLVGATYVATSGVLHMRKIRQQRPLKKAYKQTLDLKKTKALELAQQINPDKNADLLAKLATELKDEPEPTFTTSDDGKQIITQEKLILLDKHIRQLKRVEIEVPNQSNARPQLIVK
ncbi:MAG: ankyrin repeat domain-containing protein [Candidatus Berkiella sp.]